MKSKFTKLLLVVGSLVIAFSAQATRVAVTDSGTDFSHDWLKGRALINEKEVSGNLVDDDRNGKVDDVMGWNFVDDYGRIFFPEHLESIDSSIYKFFEVISRIQAGTETPEDYKFWKENVLDLNTQQKNALLARLNFYGQYAHSTHVSGIIAKISPNSKIMSNRVFPDTPPEDNQVMAQTQGGVKSKIADIIYKMLAAISNGTFNKVGTYLAERQIDVANYSLGISLQTIAKLSLSVQGVKNPTAEQISAETKKIAVQYEVEGRKWISSSPGTLFVIAAGNDGTDNDLLPTFPANVRIENAITVAASQGNSKLAGFSNFGLQSVDIAAPGVGIVSSVPSLNGSVTIPMSGTSMASPYVAGVAAKAKELNPKLKATELRRLLMETVDKKEWLKAKVISSGVINPQRVFAAAEKSKSMTLSEAIEFARVSVQDQNETLMVFKPRLSPVALDMMKFANQLAF
jgi:subtilisin family serine protease